MKELLSNCSPGRVSISPIDNSKYDPIKYREDVSQEIIDALKIFCNCASIMATKKTIKEVCWFTYVNSLGSALQHDLAIGSLCKCCTQKKESRRLFYDTVIKLNIGSLMKFIYFMIQILIPSAHTEFFEMGMNSICYNMRPKYVRDVANPSDDLLYEAMVSYHAQELKSPIFAGADKAFTKHQRQIACSIVTKKELSAVCVALEKGFLAKDLLENPQSEQVRAWFNKFFVGGALLFNQLIYVCSELARRPEYALLKTFLCKDFEQHILSIHSTFIGQHLEHQINGTEVYPKVCVNSEYTQKERDRIIDQFRKTHTFEQVQAGLSAHLVSVGYTYDYVCIEWLFGFHYSYK